MGKAKQSINIRVQRRRAETRAETNLKPKRKMRTETNRSEPKRKTQTKTQTETTLTEGTRRGEYTCAKQSKASISVYKGLNACKSFQSRSSLSALNSLMYRACFANTSNRFRLFFWYPFAPAFSLLYFLYLQVNWLAS